MSAPVQHTIWVPTLVLVVYMEAAPGTANPFASELAILCILPSAHQPSFPHVRSSSVYHPGLRLAGHRSHGRCPGSCELLRSSAHHLGVRLAGHRAHGGCPGSCESSRCRRSASDAACGDSCDGPSFSRRRRTCSCIEVPGRDEAQAPLGAVQALRCAAAALGSRAFVLIITDVRGRPKIYKRTKK
ncbi:hypothetical protein B0H11DRAFT_2030221 [Mycena galericulata]|nr:hypothetical protein B0H11DRAFT_2030221 [Mycena galericulata]